MNENIVWLCELQTKAMILKEQMRALKTLLGTSGESIEKRSLSIQRQASLMLSEVKAINELQTHLKPLLILSEQQQQQQVQSDEVMTSEMEVKLKEIDQIQTRSSWFEMSNSIQIAQQTAENRSSLIHGRSIATMDRSLLQIASLDSNSQISEAILKQIKITHDTLLQQQQSQHQATIHIRPILDTSKCIRWILISIPNVFKATLEISNFALVDSKGISHPSVSNVMIHGFNEPQPGFIPSKFGVFKAITEQALNSLFHFFGSSITTNTHDCEALSKFMLWLCSYKSLFEEPCVSCSRLIVISNPDCLPPIIRDFKTFHPYHINCYPCF